MLYYYHIPDGEYSFYGNTDVIKTKLNKRQIKDLERKAFRFFKSWSNEDNLTSEEKARRRERRITSLWRVNQEGERELLKEYDESEE